MDRPMTTVILVIHLMLAIALIGVVLLQQSEGGGLGIGGGLEAAVWAALRTSRATPQVY